MRYSNAITRRAARMIPYICGMSFLLFSIPYLYLLQPDLLAQIQHHLSGGQTSYYSLLGSLLTTLILTLSGILLQRFLHLPIRFLSLAWMPSLYALALLTCMHFPNFPSDKGSVSWFLLIVFPIIYFVLLWICKTYPDVRGEHGHTTSYLMPNLLLMATGFFYVGIVGNTSIAFHHEMKAARLLKDGQLEKALKVGKNDPLSTNYLTQVRCFAMIQNYSVGEELFQYPLSDKQTIIPMSPDSERVYDIYNAVYTYLGYQPSQRHTMTVTRFLTLANQCDTLPNTCLKSYLLINYLLNKNLKSFVHELQQTTDSFTLELPRYYRQALVLYQHTINANELGYIDDAMETDYNDFHRIYFDFTLSTEVRKSRCKDLFGDTYWFYYYFR